MSESQLLLGTVVGGLTAWGIIGETRTAISNEEGTGCVSPTYAIDWVS